MATLDLTADTEIAASPADIAAVMFDPAREPEWVSTVTAVEIVDPALQPGARVRRTGRVLGQEVSWTTTVDAVHFPHVLSLRVSDGPFSGVVSYGIQRSPGGSAVSIRVRGDAAGPAIILAEMIESPMRAALTADLERLKGLVEAVRKLRT